MSTTTFDTLKFVETLTAANVPEEQAKAHAKAISQITDNTLVTKLDLVAVKSDLEAAKSDLEKSINTLRLEVKADIKGVVIKLGGIMFLAVGVILAGIKYL